MGVMKLSHLITLFLSACSVKTSYFHSHTISSAQDDQSGVSTSWTEAATRKRITFLEDRVLIWWRKVVFTGITIPVGLVGNLLSIILLRRPAFQNMSVSFYMTALAVSDSGVLIGNFGIQLVLTFAVPIPYDAVCQGLFFTAKGCQVLSDWILAVMSAEKAVAVALPLKSRAWLGARLNYAALTTVCIMTAAYYSHAFIVYGSVNGKCSVVSFSYDAHTRSMVDYFVFILIPVLVIVISNGVIIFKVTRAKKLKLSLEVGQSALSKAKEASHNSLIIMLIGISIVYVILKTPYYVVKGLRELNFLSIVGVDSHTAAKHRLLLTILLWMLYLNNGINFFIYGLSGREYRKEMRHLVNMLMRRKSHEGNKTKSTPKELKGKL